MDDLISREKAINKFQKYQRDCEEENDAHSAAVFADAVTELEDMIAVDAVPVVHCKDCRFLGIKGLGDGYCKKKMAGIISPYDFCSYGERKDG